MKYVCIQGGPQYQPQWDDIYETTYLTYSDNNVVM